MTSFDSPRLDIVALLRDAALDRPSFAAARAAAFRRLRPLGTAMVLLVCGAVPWIAIAWSVHRLVG